LEKINLNQKATKDFLTYASAVIKSRAISSSEDNLKPVHRRILYTMAELKLWPNKKTVKSANVVGQTMLIHPHGDSSIYDAMVRLAQPWKMRYPLIEMQGNMGSILGDSAAAYRYTEARLSKFGEMMLEDIYKDAVAFKSTYDEVGKEPFVLPSKFPNILCNGNSGIAVGLSSSLVPHNLGEVVDGILAYMDYKAIGIDKLMTYIPAPDFPTGGLIVNAEKLKEIYETGNGTITLRAKYRIEEIKSQQHIVFYEVPFLVNIEEGIIDPLKKLVVEDNFDLIEDYLNETNKDGVALRIILKKNANVYKVLDALWKNTRLQVTQRVNNTIIVDGEPRTIGLKGLIQLFLSHRHDVIVSVAKYELEKIENRILIIKALMTALDRIDEVISLIKTSADKNSSRMGLIKLLSITEYQADAILDMKLGRLSKLDNIELKDELKDLETKQKTNLDLITNISNRENQIRRELISMKNLYNDKRRTLLNYRGDVEGVEAEPVKLFVFKNGTVFATQQEIESLNFKKKGTLLNQHPVQIYKETTTDSSLKIFTKDGNMVVLKTLMLGIDSFEQLPDCEPVAAFDFEKEKSDYVVFITKNGLIKKTSISEYSETRNNTKAIKLKDGDEVVSVILASNEDYIYILGDKLTKFPLKEVSPTSRLTVGVKGINGFALMAAAAKDSDKILSINDSGQGKLTLGSDFNITARGAYGQVITENTIYFSTVLYPQIFIYADKKNNVIDISKLSVKSKTAAGAKLISGTLDYISN
jgi:DNA gyrase subunit A